VQQKDGGTTARVCVGRCIVVCQVMSASLNMHHCMQAEVAGRLTMDHLDKWWANDERWKVCGHC
jgi:hypothetical protein